MSFFTAEITPAVMPMTSAMAIAIVASWIVTGSFSTMSSVTGFWMRTESPKSPRTTPEAQYQ